MTSPDWPWALGSKGWAWCSGPECWDNRHVSPCLPCLCCWDRTQAPHLLGWHSTKEPHPSRRAPTLIFRSPSWAWSQSRRVKASQPVSDRRSLYLSLSSRRRLRGGFWKLRQVTSPHLSLPSLPARSAFLRSWWVHSFFQTPFSAAVSPCGVWCWGSNPGNALSMLGGCSSTELQLLKRPAMIPFLLPQVTSLRYVFIFIDE